MPPIPPPAVAPHPEWGAHFAAEGVPAADGAFVIVDERRGVVHRYNDARCAERFIPASTFKIFNTMAGFEAGVYQDASFHLKWDGKKRAFDSWNQDLDLTRAFKFSAVWFFQEIARRVGPEKMGAYLARERYGNADPAGGIDRFWLDGALRISADEQVDFLRRLRTGKLGFPARAQSLARAVMVNARTPQGVVYGKTGWAPKDDRGRNIGWWVGFVETPKGDWTFALNVATRDPKVDMFPVRKKIANRIFATLGLPPALD